MIFINLNKCIVRGDFIDGKVWIPKDKYLAVLESQKDISRQDQNKLIASFTDVVNPEQAPPTYFRLNDLTFPFQQIVNTYGIPRYREANPALFAIVTFPFLFGIMFGDIGHGFILFLFALYLCIQKDDIIQSKSPLKAALKARYLLLLMGLFACYCGWMYNDLLSIPLNLFGSCYTNVIILIILGW